MNTPDPRKRLPQGHVKQLLANIQPGSVSARELALTHGIKYQSIYAAAKALGLQLKPSPMGRPRLK